MHIFIALCTLYIALGLTLIVIGVRNHVRHRRCAY
jgi:hypothetical protein